MDKQDLLYGLTTAIIILEREGEGMRYNVTLAALRALRPLVKDYVNKYLVCDKCEAKIARLDGRSK